MASADRPNVILSPEEKLASLLLARSGASVPIDVEQILASLAKVEVIDLTELSVDGACYLDRAGDINVLIHSGQHSNRRRFTMAHEIGHIVIPWHTGSLSCHASPDPYHHGRFEAEANRFASALLVPPDWTRDRLNSLVNPAAATEHVAQQAQVSFSAASLAIARASPPGWFFVELDREGRVVMAAHSAGTCASLPSKGSNWSADECPSCTAYHCADKRITWIELPSRKIGPPPRERSSILLKSVLARHRDCLSYQSIQGIVGHAAGKVERTSAERIFEHLWQRFVGRAEAQGLVDDPMFIEYLTARAYELADRG